MQRIHNTQQSSCNKCNSSKWIINSQGNLICAQSQCGFTQSLGYLIHEEEGFRDQENPKTLSRALPSGGELFIKGIYQVSTENITEEEEYHLRLFNKCVSLFPHLNQRDIFDEQMNFSDSWQKFQESGQHQSKNTISFVFTYCLNRWCDFFPLEEIQQFQQALKYVLNIKEEVQVKKVSVDNQLTTNENLLKLMQSQYPNLTEEEFAVCENNLEEIRNLINCSPSTLLCVTVYDLLLNFLKVKKVDIQKLVESAHKVMNSEGQVLKANTIKRHYKNIQGKRNQNNQKKPTYSI